MVSEKIKEYFFEYLEKELSDYMVIPHDGTLWWLDLEKEKWCFGVTDSKSIFWNYDILIPIINLFPIESSEYNTLFKEFIQNKVNFEIHNPSLSLTPVQFYIDTMFEKIEKNNYISLNKKIEK